MSLRTAVSQSEDRTLKTTAITILLALFALAGCRSAPLRSAANDVSPIAVGTTNQGRLILRELGRYPPQLSSKRLVRKQSLTVTVASRYVPNLGVVASDKPVIQTDYSTELGNGWNAGVWWSMGLDDANPDSNFGDEVDIWASYSWGKFSAKAQYIALFDLGDAGDDLLNLELKWTDKFQLCRRLTFAPAVELDGWADTKTWDLTWSVTPQAKLVWQVCDGVGLFASAGGNYDSGTSGFEATWIPYGKMGFDLKLPGSTLTPFVAVYSPQANDRDDSKVLGLSWAPNL